MCEFFEVPCESVDASPQLANPLSDLTDPLFLAPDAGAVELAVAARDAYRTEEINHFEKRRISDTEVEIQPSDASTAGRDIVLVDDSIATGLTIATAIEQFEEPNSVFVTCVHHLLVGNARTKIETAGVEAMYATDTIERSVSTVSAVPVIAARL